MPVSCTVSDTGYAQLVRSLCSSNVIKPDAVFSTFILKLEVQKCFIRYFPSRDWQYSLIEIFRNLAEILNHSIENAPIKQHTFMIKTCVNLQKKIHYFRVCFHNQYQKLTNTYFLISVLTNLIFLGILYSTDVIYFEHYKHCFYFVARSVYMQPIVPVNIKSLIGYLKFYTAGGKPIKLRSWALLNIHIENLIQEIYSAISQSQYIVFIYLPRHTPIIIVVFLKLRWKSVIC